MEYKDFIKLTNISIKKYASKRFRQLMHQEENYAIIFEMIVKSYYMWDINKAPDKTKTAESYAVYRGSYPIRTIVKNLRQSKVKPNISLDKVEYKLESTKTKTYNYVEREETKQLTEFYIENSGLTNAELKYMKLFGQGYSLKEIASHYNIRTQYVSYCIQNAQRKINRTHEFPEI